MALSAAFANTSGAALDPETVIFKTHSPCGKDTTYTYGTDENVTRQSTGNYQATFVADTSGRWHTRWEGTDVFGNVIVIEDFFAVQKSRFTNDCFTDYA